MSTSNLFIDYELWSGLSGWTLIERIILSREALILALIAAIVWLAQKLNQREKENRQLYQKLEQLLTGALISEKVKNFLSGNNRQAKDKKQS